MSKCTFLCGYKSRVSSNIILFSSSTQSKPAFGCAFRWVSPFMTSTTSVFSYMASRSLSQSFWVNLHQRSRLWLGCEACVPWRRICLNSNLQVDKMGWTNQTIPCFLLSSLTWMQSWIASLYSGWYRIWRYHFQRLKPFVDWCACFYQTQAISSLSLWQLCAV